MPKPPFPKSGAAQGERVAPRPPVPFTSGPALANAKLTAGPASSSHSIPSLLDLSTKQVIRTLELVRTSKDVPYRIRKASSDALRISKAVEMFKSHSSVRIAFSGYIQHVTLIFINAVAENADSDTSKIWFDQLGEALDDIMNQLDVIAPEDIRNKIYSYKNRVDLVLNNCEIDRTQKALKKITQDLGDPGPLVSKLESSKTQTTSGAPVIPGASNDAGKLSAKPRLFPATAPAPKNEVGQMASRVTRANGAVPRGLQQGRGQFAPASPAAARAPVSAPPPLPASPISKGTVPPNDPEAKETPRPVPRTSSPIVVWGMSSITERDRRRDRGTSGRVQSGASPAREAAKTTHPSPGSHVPSASVSGLTRVTERDETQRQRHGTRLRGDRRVQSGATSMDERQQAPSPVSKPPTTAATGTLEPVPCDVREAPETPDSSGIKVRVQGLHRAIGSVGERVLGDVRRSRQDVADLCGEIHNIKRSVGNASQKDHERSTLGLLQYASGASWDSSQVCHAGTRVNILNEIMEFLRAPADKILSLRIVLLTGVVGCGKTAIAHTVAKNCADNQCRMLGSSFFFSCEVDERRRPDKLFSTISRDICDRDSIFRASVCSAIEEERALACAPMPRQFSELVLKPAKDASQRRTHPLTILIDALDEGFNEDLLRILEESAALVPAEFRFLITTRSEAPIILPLRKLRHIALKEINIRDNVNCEDVKIFVAHRLNDIARNHDIENWLDDNLITRFNRHAEGLFIWAATVCNHVNICPSPVEDLDDLLNDRGLLDPQATEKMNKLYAKILSKCPWSNRHFMERYELCLGVVIALKRPLSIPSIEKLLEDKHASTAFRPLSSLLIGALSRDQPVQIAHSTLRDYITCCNRGGRYADARFAISEVDHSRRLALRCIVALNSELPRLHNSVASVFNEKRDVANIPILKDSDLAEHVWYACQHWIDHIQDVESPSDKLCESLAQFLDKCFLTWIAVGAARGKYIRIGKFYAWFKKLELHRVALDQTAVSKLLFALTRDLWVVGRLEEALEAVLDCVALTRDLARSNFYPDLAPTLYNLSIHHSELGNREEAVHAVWESVDLYRELARYEPHEFNRGLALSLYGLSVDLCKLSRRREALEAVQECVDLCRGLARNQPSAFSPDLALALYHLPVHVRTLGCHEEVLETVQRCEVLRDGLACDPSSPFNSNLALSLHKFSTHLSNLGRREDALEAARKCVDIRRHLARGAPRVFNSDLGRALKTLSKCLSDLGREEEALNAGREAERFLAL